MKATELDRILGSALLVSAGYDEKSARSRSWFSRRVRRQSTAFRDLGYTAEFFVVGSGEYFLLKRENDPQEITVVFVGTTTFCDWIKNATVRAMQDVPNPGTGVLPLGHGGFRSIAMCALKKGLVQNIRDFAPTRNEPSGKTKLRLLGHSQGAGVVQLLALALNGWAYGANAQIEKVPSWEFEVVEVTCFAPPYAILKQSPRGGLHSAVVERIERELASKWSSVIRDDDIVPVLYLPLQLVARNWLARIRGLISGPSILQSSVSSPLFRHFGRLVRISHDGAVSVEYPTWSNEETHSMSMYLSTIQSAAAKASGRV